MSLLGRIARSKLGMTTALAGAALTGVATKAAPAGRDAAMDVAFGDPNADEYFLGRKLTPGSFFDASMGGNLVGGTVAGSGQDVSVGKGALVGGAAGALTGSIGTSMLGGNLKASLAVGAVGGVLGAVTGGSVGAARRISSGWNACVRNFWQLAWWSYRGVCR